MTEVRTFKAGSMQEALERVRNEMGGEAVILHTRQTERPRLFGFWKPRQEVEITAGLGVNVRPLRRRAEAPAAAPRFTAEVSDRGVEVGRRTSDVGSQKSEAEKQETGPSSLESGLQLSALSSRPDAGTPHAALRTPLSSDAQPSALNPQLASQLDTIQRMLEDLGKAGAARGATEVPSELFHLYADLIDAEVEEDLARELVFRLRQNCTPEQLGDAAASRALLTAMVESEIRCSDPISATRGKRKVVALVGSTGVGKTTTIAKLAANLRLREGIKMGLVTVDTYRIAAVEQLRTYAEIIDLPMRVVTNPLEMRRTMDELVGLDLVLIDTAGRSPRDELQIQELKRLLVEAQVDEVHLVLSLTAGLRSLLATAEKFAAAGTTSLVLTKLDEAASMGTVLSLCRKVQLPISYLTTGQDVPDDIEPARSSRVARLVLGQDRLAE